MFDITRRIVFALLAGMLAFWTFGVDPGICETPSGTETNSQAMTMSLPEAVNIALRNNRNIKSAYLERVVQKFDLKVALDKFSPNINLSSGPSASGSGTDTEGESGTDTSSSWGLNTSIALDKLFSYGGSFSLSQSRSDQYSDASDSQGDWTGSNTWQVSFSQPLLRGFGRDVNTASVTLAQISEQSSLLSLRDSVISTVNQTISAFRSYARAVRSVEIVKQSVERSRALLETNKLLISMGRMPANEIIQTESDVANQELSYETALNSMDNARLSLIQVLDLDQNTRIVPVEETDLTPVHPDLDDCLAIAFKNRSDYANARFSLERALISLDLARDNMKWDLNATGSYSYSDTTSRRSSNSDSGSWSLGLNLSIPLYGDLTREQGLLSAQTSLEKTKLSLKEVEQTITLGVKNAIREVETSLKQVGMAVRARELAEQKLAVEKEKLAVGRSTNFQLVTYQNDLVRSQQSELDAKVAYLDALKALDDFLATTLDTWKIDYNKEYDQWPGR